MLSRQAKTLTSGQIKSVLLHVDQTRNPKRNRLIFLLSLRAGLRAKEIAELTWGMVTDAEGHLLSDIRLENTAAKGNSGGVIPMAAELRAAFQGWMSQSKRTGRDDRVITTERSGATTAPVIVNLFQDWYQALGFQGCSSHSGRRTFITGAARKIGFVGGSLRDVQHLARHSSLAMTQRYIELCSSALRKVVDII